MALDFIGRSGVMYAYVVFEIAVLPKLLVLNHAVAHLTGTAQ